MEVQATEQSSPISADSSVSDSSAADVSASSSDSFSSPSGEQQARGESAAPVIPADQGQAYVPDYKFKAANKEHEIDDWLRPAIKSKEHEQKLKEMYEKAFGIDEVKSSRDKVREEYKTYKQQYEPILQPVMEAARYYKGAEQAYKENNIQGAVFKMEEAFKHLGMSDQMLMKYVYHKVQMEDLPQHQKESYNRQREADRRLEQMEQTVQTQEQFIQQTRVNERYSQLNQAISKPEVAPIIQAFDQRNGPGSFQTEVIKLGQLYALPQMGGKDVPADQLVQELITKFGLSAPSPAQPQATVQSQNVPVIPVIKPGSSSPAARTFTTLDDVKRFAKEQFG